MIEHILFLLIFFNLIYSHDLQAQTPPQPSGRRLRIIVEDKYSDNNIIIGCTTGSWAFGTNTGLVMDREFNYVTPENDFKQWNIHRNNSSYWNWAEPDAWINHITTNGQILRMHGPIGPQCSQWAQNDSRTASELDTNMKDFMQALCERYNGTPGFEYMDVVNETVINGSWHTDKPGYGWENPWFKIGQDTDRNRTPLYIKKAFQIANQYAPNIKLIYNHHEHPEMLDSWTLIKETIAYLRNQGLRVDGIGWQAHVDVSWETSENLQNLRDLIDWAHSNQLEFHVTEASVWLKQDNSQTYIEQQAETYRTIMEVILEKRSSGKVGWNTWHIDDGHGWNTQWYPSLFNANYVAKPAYYAIQEALETAPLGFVDSQEEYINTFQLFNNYPNSFNPITTISYQLPKSEFVNLSIYNVAGQLVETMVSEYKNVGYHSVIWNASGIGSGLYFYRIEAGDYMETKKCLILK